MPFSRRCEKTAWRPFAPLVVASARHGLHGHRSRRRDHAMAPLSPLPLPREVEMAPIHPAGTARATPRIPFGFSRDGEVAEADRPRPTSSLSRMTGPTFNY